MTPNNYTMAIMHAGMVNIEVCQNVRTYKATNLLILTNRTGIS